MDDMEEIKDLLKRMDKNRIQGRRNMLLWRSLELIALAHDHGQGGLLPSVEVCARQLKISRKAMAKTLHEFNKSGVVHSTPQGWMVDRLQEELPARDGPQPILHARRRHARAARRGKDGDGVSRQAIPYYD